MANAYYRGKRVSVSHAAILNAYERKHGPVQLNQGRRTLAEQWYFWRLYKSGRGNLAAYPNPGAPHIKAGREHHALDINAGSGRGQAQHVAAFYRSLGIPVAFNVRSEPWHMDTLDESALKRAAGKLGAHAPVLRYKSRGKSVITLKKLLYDNGIRGYSSTKNGVPSDNRYNPFFGRYTVQAVKRFQRENGLAQDGVVGPTTWKKLRANVR